MHLRNLCLGADLDPLVLQLLEVLHADDSDAVVAGGRDLARGLADAEAVQVVLVVLHRRQLLRHLLHLRADDHNISQREADDQVAVAEPRVALHRAVLRLERELGRFRGVSHAEEEHGGVPEHHAHGLFSGALVGVVALDVGELDLARLVLQPEGILGLEHRVAALVADRDRLVLGPASEDVVDAMPHPARHLLGVLPHDGLLLQRPLVVDHHVAARRADDQLRADPRPGQEGRVLRIHFEHLQFLLRVAPQHDRSFALLQDGQDFPILVPLELQDLRRGLQRNLLNLRAPPVKQEEVPITLPD
mmetsp:Transcript_3972/g.10753  ORF Transcript_3972/g.10753 Transcript_3972/m.10753 type:complete len:304 (-) Transcript_3972:150-1061(-)